MTEKKGEDKVETDTPKKKGIEEIHEIVCPILNFRQNTIGLEVSVKYVDAEPYQIMGCPEYCKIKVDKDIDEIYETFNCALKKEGEDQSCIHSKWKRL